MIHELTRGNVVYCQPAIVYRETRFPPRSSYTEVDEVSSDTVLFIVHVITNEALVITPNSLGYVDVYSGFTKKIA